MKVTCPGCNTSYTFNENKMTRVLAQVACKRCETNLVFLKRPAQEGAEAPAIAVGRHPSPGPDPEKRRRWTVSRVAKYAALGLIGFIVVGVLAVYGLFYFTEKSDEYKKARAFITESPEVRDEVGGRIDRGPSMESFNIKTSGDAGSADMTFGVTGPAGDAKVRVLLIKEKGVWRVERAALLGRDGAPREIATERKHAAGRPTPRPEASPRQADLSEEVKEHLTAAHRLHREKKYKAAIEEYSRALALDPKNPGAYYWRGVSYVKEGASGKGLEDLEKTVAIAPSYAPAYESMAWVHGKEKRYDECIASLTELIGLKPGYAKAYYKRGSAYFKKGDVDRAYTDIKRSCEMGYVKGCDALKRLDRTI